MKDDGLRATLEQTTTHCHQRVHICPLPGYLWSPPGLHTRSPVLFIMFMNWLTKVPLSDNTKLILYADDILLYKPVNSDQDSDAFQQDVNSIQNWTNSHGLKLNASESCLMNITRAKNPPRLIPRLHLTIIGPARYGMGCVR